MRRIKNYQKLILNNLIGEGVSVAIGSDAYGESIFTEIDYLNENKIVDRYALIDMICKVNPQLIFPNRKIGEIKTGYEANFLVLEKDPTIDLQNLKTVTAVYMGGKRLISNTE